jgi:beta-1,4-N-acetylglucosaminyltransferase
MLMMTKHLNATLYRPVEYCKAVTDTTSVVRLQTMRGSGDFIVHDVPRSREVGQSYISSIFTTLRAAAWAAALVFFRARPQLLLCNGPGTCIPVVFGVLLRRILFGWMPGADCCVVFVESYCRVETLSLTGKLLYFTCTADLFVVHWKELNQRFPDAVLTSSFIRHGEEKG